MMQCNFVWDSPSRGTIRCLEPFGHGRGTRHQNGQYCFVVVGAEDALNGRWINLNLEDARLFVREIGELKEVQRRLKDAFAKDELDGGALAALDHPLYLQAQAEINRLEQEFKQLI